MKILKSEKTAKLYNLIKLFSGEISLHIYYKFLFVYLIRINQYKILILYFYFFLIAFFIIPQKFIKNIIYCSQSAFKDNFYKYVLRLFRDNLVLYAS